MGTGRIKPPGVGTAAGPAKPDNSSPARAEPHPRLVRLAKEVGAEIPLPPVAPRKLEAEPAPRPKRAYRVTIIRPDPAEEK
jgi:hypothetical protein